MAPKDISQQGVHATKHLSIMSPSYGGSYEVVAEAVGTWSAELKPDGKTTLPQVMEAIQQLAMNNKFPGTAYVTLSETAVTELTLARDPSRGFEPTAPLIES